MSLPEKNLRDVSLARISAAVRGHGSQKSLALDLGMTDVELSRLVNETAPKLCSLLAHLGLEIVDADHVTDLRKVLKSVL